MRDILTILKKEIKSVFQSKQILFQIIVVPLILILAGSLLSFTLIDSTMETQENFKIDGYVVNAPDVFADAFTELGLKNASEDDIDTIKESIAEDKAHVLLVFPQDFELTYDQEALQNVEMWYNSAGTDSAYAQPVIMGVLDSVRPNLFTINAENTESYDLADESDTFAMTMEVFFPMYAIMGVFCAVMALASESIVGDKERGFMNLLLITPVKRRHIAFGKALNLFVVNVFSSIAVIIGVILSAVIYENMNLGGSVNYGFVTYATLFICVLFGAFSMTSVCLLISTSSKTIKQANNTCSLLLTAVTIGNFISTLPTFQGVLSSSGSTLYLIPVFNLNLCMQDAINSSTSITNLLMSLGINLALAFTLTIYSAKLFDNEKVMQG